MANSSAKNNTNNQSSIGMALAGQTHRVDIPKPHQAAESRAVATGSRSAPAHKGVDLPTPPASISPSLPPQVYQQHKQALLGVISPPSPPSNQGFESDIDLQDAVAHARAQDAMSRPKRREPAAVATAGAQVAVAANANGLKSLDANALAAFDSSTAITAAMLARDYLPNILLEHGPLAIRYIMGFLTQNVPGFGGIPAAKARRLVVSALEGGFNQEVEFEKVGWGRWDAHKAGEPSRIRQTSPGRELSGLPRYDTSRERSQTSRERSVDDVYPAYPSQPMSSLRVPRPANIRRGSSQLANSFSPDLAPVPFELETDMDRMSMDGGGGDEDRSGGGSSTTNPDDLPAVDDDDMDDATDEEDWASIGAAALRQASISHSHGSSRMLSAYSHSHGARHAYPMTLSHRPRDHGMHAGVHKRTAGGVRNNSLTKSAPSPKMVARRVVSEDALKGCTDDSERQAIAALMSLGGM